MTDCTELIRQLKTYEDGYGLYDDAATAIEELSAQLADKDRLIKVQWNEIRHLRADVLLQQEKLIELAKKLPNSSVELLP